jgi:phosphopantothenoylcysteine decarboxylase/phosphopantothenate--cysteine ligase
MSSLSNKRILLGVTGGIAAYKSADLIRRLQDLGAEVRVIMTAAAQQFITPLTLQALSGNPVHCELLDAEAEAGMGHIELARWGDLLIVAPASADFIARLSAGQGDDLLSTACLASPSPIAIAPAMNQAMYGQPATQHNLAVLAQRQVHIFGPASGIQACGDIGPGRMLEAPELAQLCAGLLQSGSLTGKRVVITAGPTQEAIDPVRYISNHSSGKMGFALAQACVDAGAHTTIIAGPCQLPTPDRCHRVNITSAQEMYDAALGTLGECDIFIAAAAVADFRPAAPSEQKIKKNTGEDQMTIDLVKNPDIVAAVAGHTNRPFTVGFAAETQNLERHAKAKLENKKLDMIVANDVSQEGIGFNSDDNQVKVIIHKEVVELPIQNKQSLARKLVEMISTNSHS